MKITHCLILVMTWHDMTWQVLELEQMFTSDCTEIVYQVTYSNWMTLKKDISKEAQWTGFSFLLKVSLLN